MIDKIELDQETMNVVESLGKQWEQAIELDPISENKTPMSQEDVIKFSVLFFFFKFAGTMSAMDFSDICIASAIRGILLHQVPVNPMLIPYYVHMREILNELNEKKGIK